MSGGGIEGSAGNWMVRLGRGIPSLCSSIKEEDSREYESSPKDEHAREVRLHPPLGTTSRAVTDAQGLVWSCGHCPHYTP